jgi:hypothetical protein
VIPAASISEPKRDRPRGHRARRGALHQRAQANPDRASILHRLGERADAHLVSSPTVRQPIDRRVGDQHRDRFLAVLRDPSLRRVSAFPDHREIEDRLSDGIAHLVERQRQEIVPRDLLGAQRDRDRSRRRGERDRTSPHRRDDLVITERDLDRLGPRRVAAAHERTPAPRHRRADLTGEAPRVVAADDAALALDARAALALIVAITRAREGATAHFRERDAQGLDAAGSIDRGAGRLERDPEDASVRRRTARAAHPASRCGQADPARAHRIAGARLAGAEASPVDRRRRCDAGAVDASPSAASAVSIDGALGTDARTVDAGRRRAADPRGGVARRTAGTGPALIAGAAVRARGALAETDRRGDPRVAGRALSARGAPTLQRAVAPREGGAREAQQIARACRPRSAGRAEVALPGWRRVVAAAEPTEQGENRGHEEGRYGANGEAEHGAEYTEFRRQRGRDAERDVMLCPTAPDRLALPSSHLIFSPP